MNGPISCVAPYPTEEHPGPETYVMFCHHNGHQKNKTPNITVHNLVEELDINNRVTSTQK